LAKDYPEYLSIVREVENEVRKCEREITESIKTTPELNKTKSWFDCIDRKRELVRKALNEKLASTSQRVSDIISKIDLLRDIR
jgi:hypothetical protein